MTISPGSNDKDAKHCIYQPFVTRDTTMTQQRCNMPDGIDPNEMVSKQSSHMNKNE